MYNLTDDVIDNIYMIVIYHYPELHISKDTIRDVINKRDRVSLRKDVKNLIIRISAGYNYVYGSVGRRADITFAKELYSIFSDKLLTFKNVEETVTDDLSELSNREYDAELIIGVSALYLLREFTEELNLEFSLLMFEKILFDRNIKVCYKNTHECISAVKQIVYGYWDKRTLGVIRDATETF